MTVLTMHMPNSKLVICTRSFVILLVISKIVIIVIKELVVLARVRSSGCWLIASAAWSKWWIFMFNILHRFSLFILLNEFIIKYIVKFIFLLSKVFFHVYWIYLGAWKIIHESLFFPILLFLKSRITLVHFINFLINFNKLTVL